MVYSCIHISLLIGFVIRTMLCCVVMTTDYIIFRLDCDIYFLFYKIIVSEDCVLWLT